MRIARLADYALVAHRILLVLLALIDLGTYVFFYLTLARLTLLLKFRVRLLVSGLPKDLRRSVYDLYKSYVDASLSLDSVRDLLSLTQLS